MSCEQFFLHDFKISLLVTPLHMRSLEDWLPAFTSFLSSMMSIIAPIVGLNHLSTISKVVAKASTVPGSILYPTKLMLTI